MKTLNFISRKYLVLTITLLFLLPIGQTLAADIIVDADCSLPNAIRSANSEDLVEPMADCEPGDSDRVDEETPPGLDTITIDIDGTVEGLITIEDTLAVTSNIEIDGGGYRIDGAGKQIFSVAGGSLAIQDLVLSNGYSATNGGAIAVLDGALSLANSAIQSSAALGQGGGIYSSNSDVTLSDSDISGNTTGGASTDAHDHSAHAHSAEDAAALNAQSAEPIPVVENHNGGGLYFVGESSSLIIDRSGVASNASPESGGGIYIASGSATISNSTISGNSAGADGGGIYNAGASILTHVTVVGNSAANGGGIFDAALLQLYNSILSGNTGGDCSGSLNANLGNLIRDNSCNHDGLTDDPMLLLLAGSPAYYLPQERSPAIDAAIPEYCSALDQRGINRLPGSCDIGASEHQAGAFSFQIQSALAVLTPGEGGGSDDAEEEEEEPEPTPVQSNCGELPDHIIVTEYTHSVFCKTMDHVGIGNELLVNNGAIYAVDLFGWVATPLTVCFQHESGAIVLLDAANSPRNIVPLTTWTDGDKQCATVDRVGSAVLMPLTFFTSGVIPELIWNLTECSVTTTDILNLREGPSTDTATLANVLNNVTLSADRRNLAFFRVNYYGVIGWLSADYLSGGDDCR